jgi:hypothetical protein
LKVPEEAGQGFHRVILRLLDLVFR